MSTTVTGFVGLLDADGGLFDTVKDSVRSVLRDKVPLGLPLLVTDPVEGEAVRDASVSEGVMVRVPVGEKEHVVVKLSDGEGIVPDAEAVGPVPDLLKLAVEVTLGVDETVALIPGVGDTLSVGDMLREGVGVRVPERVKTEEIVPDVVDDGDTEGLGGVGVELQVGVRVSLRLQLREAEGLAVGDGECRVGETEKVKVTVETVGVAVWDRV